MSLSGTDGICKLSQIYDNKTLYNAYPMLRDIFVVATADLGQTDGKFYVDRTGSMVIEVSSSMVEKKRLQADDKVTLLHEIQHAIQKIEKFARGGSPKTSVQDTLDFIERQRNILQEKAATANPEEQDKIVKQLDELQKQEDEIYETDGIGRDIQADLLYYQLGGEQEAREVEKRALDKKWGGARYVREIPPTIHTGDAIIVFYGKEFSAASAKNFAEQEGETAANDENNNGG